MEIDEVLEEEGINKDRLEAAIEIGRLAANELGLCCQELGKFCWLCYQKLESEKEE
jgi:hypothetical protein